MIFSEMNFPPSTDRPCASIIIPVLNEEHGIRILLERLEEVTCQLTDYRWEIVFVDDGSTDATLQCIKQHRHLFGGALCVVEFSRNFGQQPALLAGLQKAEGDLIFCIDADLQDPPELFGQLLQKYQEGFDVVYAIRKSRRESILKRFAYSLFYRIMHRLTEIPIPMDAGDFGLISRRVALVILQCPDKDLYLRGLRSWSGFRQVGVGYERPQRAMGYPKYSFRKLIRLAGSGLLGFSSLPLRFASGVGMLTVVLCFLYGIEVCCEKLFWGVPPTGWASTVLIILFLGGVQLLSIGLLGEYVGRIYKQLQPRPLFVIKETHVM